MVADSDADGLPDGAELGTGTFGPQRVISTAADRPVSVSAADLDHDGDMDVDGDGWSDGEEIAAGSDPLDPGSTPMPPQVPMAGALGRALLAFGMLLAGVRAARLRGRRASP